MKLMNLARRNIFRNLRRSILSGSAIVLAVATIVFLFAFIAGIKNDMATQIKDYVTGEVRIQNKDYEKNESLFPLYLALPEVSKTLEVLDKDPLVKAAVARIAFPGVYFLEDEQKPLVGWAVDFDREEHYAGFKRILTEGNLPTSGRRELLLGTEVAKELNFKTGDEISILYRTARMSSNYMTLKISGLVQFPLGALNKRIFLVSRDLMGPKLFLEDEATQILVKTKSGNPTPLVQELQNTLPKDWDIRSWEQVSSLYSFMGLAEFLYDFIAIFFYLLASSVIISTTMMVIFERIREIGTISALGMTENEILRLFFLEAFQISVVSSLLGLIIGIILVTILSFTGIDMSNLLDKVDLGIGGVIYPALNWQSVVVAPILAVVVSSLGALIPARRATKIQPVEALRTYS